MARSNLYVLAESGHPEPATLDAFNSWEDSIPDEQKCALGKRLAVDHVGGVTVVSVFILTAIGWHNRKPQVFLTQAVGDGVWTERRYTSLRACLNGHRDELREQRKLQSNILSPLI
ncbi:hypothetical protein Pla52o_39370 [Novipirellula galeiformis]|uniref:Uncharacterized protein n=1 Tax=Novipirellula galeiformis TaxID=2528004 RepID=A0A5C6CAW6_9BACT|nr:hypothetical protein [Novipirellula galeiformis]TWU21750.1 hypothetical protein Pla52o_39370 [Novipirellula galeiformis]